MAYNQAWANWGTGQGGGTPTYTPPPPPTFSNYTAPARNEGRIRKLTQLAAAPGLRGLRNATNRAISKNYDNPNVARMTARDALAGYGEGLESTLAGAKQSGLSEYNQEYAPQLEASRANWQQQNQATMMTYQGALEKSRMDWQSAQAERDRELKEKIAFNEPDVGSYEQQMQQLRLSAARRSEQVAQENYLNRNAPTNMGARKRWTGKGYSYS